MDKIINLIFAIAIFAGCENEDYVTQSDYEKDKKDQEKRLGSLEDKVDSLGSVQESPGTIDTILVNHEDTGIVGQWIRKDGENTYAWTIREDGTGIFSEWFNAIRYDGSTHLVYFATGRWRFNNEGILILSQLGGCSRDCRYDTGRRGITGIDCGNWGPTPPEIYVATVTVDSDLLKFNQYAIQGGEELASGWVYVREPYEEPEFPCRQ